MEYFPLGDLQDYTTDHAPMPESDVGSIVAQVLGGLDQMHSQGFAHRDIKPGVSKRLSRDNVHSTMGLRLTVLQRNN